MSRFILLLLLQTLMAYTGENYCTFFHLYIKYWRVISNVIVRWLTSRCTVCWQSATIHFREHCHEMATRCTGYPSENLETPLGRAQILRKLKSH